MIVKSFKVDPALWKRWAKQFPHNSSGMIREAMREKLDRSAPSTESKKASNGNR